MLHLRFIRRQLAQSKKQAVVFVLAVALSMITLVALGGFRESVNRTVLRDAKQLHAGDIIASSSFPFSEPLLKTVKTLERQGEVKTTTVYEFLSVVRVAGGEETLLSSLKVVEPVFPFYGEVHLASGRPLRQVLKGGQIVVEQNLLDRLLVRVGDQLRIGEATLMIADVVLLEPDRPVNFFSLGPRIFVAKADLGAINLVQKGSRVSYRLLLKIADETQLDALAARIEAMADPIQERIETYQTAESAVKRFFDDFLFYLSLIGVFTLLLAGIGIQTALTAYLREREKTIAIVKTLGGTSGFVDRQYLAVVALLGGVGGLLGLGLGLSLQTMLPTLFQNFLPPNVELVISWRAIIESQVLGLFVVGAFTFIPLFRLRDVRPSFILRHDQPKTRRSWPYYLTIAAVFIFFGVTVLWQLGNPRVGGYFILGTLALIGLTALLTELVLWLLRRRYVRMLVVRQAVRGLFRPRNATRSIIITLAASLAVIFSIYLIEQNLNANFLQAYPEEAPNVFFLDIQPAQVEAFAAALGLESTYYPVIRGRITAVNGQPLNRDRERERDGDNLERTFNLTYRDFLLEGETISAGRGLNVEDIEGIQVSILDDMLEIRDFKLGDVISFNIQGIFLDATVTSIRTRTTDSIEPFFNFVFPKEALENAPQTIFTAVQVEPEQIAPLQNRIVAAFPNVNVIDVTVVIRTVSDLIRDLTQVIRFFTLFSIAAGMLLLVSSIFATRFARTQEAVYFKVLGAKGKFVLQVFTLENLFLGLVSAALALLMSQLGSWIIISQVFDITYSPLVGPSLGLTLVTVLLVITVGLLASISILQHKPIAFLRENNEV
jgi:putative ABC transport system permease protein